MTTFVLVAFDPAHPKAGHPRVKTALGKIRLKKSIRSKKSGKLSHLPANTIRDIDLNISIKIAPKKKRGDNR